MAEIFFDSSKFSNGNGKVLSVGTHEHDLDSELDEQMIEWINQTGLNPKQNKLLKEKFIEHMICDLETLKTIEPSHVSQLELPLGVRSTFEKSFVAWKKKVQTQDSKRNITPTGSSSSSTTPGITYFEACEETILTMCGDEEKIITIKVVHQELKDQLKNYLSSSVWYEEEPVVKAMELLQFLPSFKTSGSPSIISLSNFLEKQFEELTSKVNKMIQEGVIDYASLWYTFQKGTKVYTWDDRTSNIIGTSISSSKYQRSCWFPSFKIEGEIIKTDGIKFFMTKERWTIPAFSGVMKLTELPVRLMNDQILKQLTERGKVFRSIGLGHHYMAYNGTIMWRTWCGVNEYKATGRVMIDGSSFSRLNPNYTNFNSSNKCNDTDMEGLMDENLFMSYATVPGFSFAAKKWGEISVEKLTPIIYDSLAYERLVLPQEKKSLIKALVLNNSERTSTVTSAGTRKKFSDLISGKGDGCIFLLHGPPGVGKTLTAEAIAELLQKPLYSVSVGELGTNTTELENKLRDILEVASTWNAVILIDEADIFLEKRNESDIVRNAMVGIFLRLLEYHQGVLFLTTNRVKTFDSAFHSRISVALKYDGLDSNARAQIWATFLDSAGIPFVDRRQQQQGEEIQSQSSDSESEVKALDPWKLSRYPLNGRQIRTTVRLAQALAEQENVPVGPQHIDVTVKIADQFHNDLND